jgi:hypothetical protein
VRAQAAARVDEGAPRIADREAARREESWDDVTSPGSDSIPSSCALLSPLRRREGLGFGVMAKYGNQPRTCLPRAHGGVLVEPDVVVVSKRHGDDGESVRKRRLAHRDRVARTPGARVAPRRRSPRLFSCTCLVVCNLKKLTFTHAVMHTGNETGKMEHAPNSNRGCKN